MPRRRRSLECPLPAVRVSPPAGAGMPEYPADPRFRCRPRKPSPTARLPLHRRLVEHGVIGRRIGDCCRTTRMVGCGACSDGRRGLRAPARATGLPKPVATTVTRIWLVMSGSMTVPTTTVASSEANCLMTLPTSWNSPMDRSMPAVTFTRMPCAPARLMSSSKRAGDRRLRRFARAIVAATRCPSPSSPCRSPTSPCARRRSRR